MQLPIRLVSGNVNENYCFNWNKAVCVEHMHEHRFYYYNI